MRIIRICFVAALLPLSISAYAQDLWIPAGASLGGSGTYSLASGSLPAGLQLNASTGQITGTPTQAGSYSFQYQAASNGDFVIGRIDVASPPSDGDAPLPLWSLLVLGGGLMGVIRRKSRSGWKGSALWMCVVLLVAAQALDPDQVWAGQAPASALASLPMPR